MPNPIASLIPQAPTRKAHGAAKLLASWRLAMALVLSLVAIAALALHSPGSAAPALCEVGPPSGKDQTSQIQRAIDDCPAGGTVLLQAGAEYVAGSLFLKSDITLKFGSADTTLRSSSDPAKIKIIPQTSHKGFVIAVKARDVAIQGPGKILKGAAIEHSMVEFQRSSGVRVSNLTIDSRGIAAPGFHLVTQGSDNVTFEGITIYGQQVSSGWPWGGNDGIDIQNSQDVVVRDCYIETHDDGIAIASPKTEPVENVLVENCTVSSDSAAIKFGTGSYADMRNITLRDITIRKSRNAGIRIVVLDGGTIEHVTFSNFTFEKGIGAWLLCGQGGTSGAGGCVDIRKEGIPMGEVRDLVFENFTFQGDPWATSKLNEITRLTLRNFHFNGADAVIRLWDICGLSISGWKGDENIDVDMASSVTDVVYDGRPPRCQGQGPGPSPTPPPPQPTATPTPRATATPTPIFADVPTDHWARGAIEGLYQEGLLAGCSQDPLLFCPEQGLSRAEMAVFVERGVHGTGFMPTTPTSQVFLDVAMDTWFAKWTTALWEEGFTSGCSSEPALYCPHRIHTRAEATVFFERILHGASFSPDLPTQQLYSDVAIGPEAPWYSRWVYAAHADDLLEPCEDPTNRGDDRYRPQQAITRAEAACMLAIARGLQP